MEKQLYDDCFYVEHRKWGTWQSTDKEGKGIITSITEEECIRATRWYLKMQQDGRFDKIEEKTYDGTVGGKL